MDQHVVQHGCPCEISHETLLYILLVAESMQTMIGLRSALHVGNNVTLPCLIFTEVSQKRTIHHGQGLRDYQRICWLPLLSFAGAEESKMPDLVAHTAHVV